jgi:hypothetical protein
MTAGWHPQTRLRNVETHRMRLGGSPELVNPPCPQGGFMISHFKLDFRSYFFIIGLS